MHKIITNERLLRCIEDGNVRDALDEPLQLPKSRKSRLEGVLKGAVTEDNAISTITMGKFLYDYLRINPLVVDGIDFARSDQFRSIFEFSRFAAREVRNGLMDSKGGMSALKGYVAERFAAWDLQSKGHDVVFPRTPNNPGWDLLLDGRKFQVKCVTDPAEVWKHLRLYPDIPVLVNAEMADEFAGVTNVHILPTLKDKDVYRATEDTLRHGEGLARFEIPWISLMVLSGSALAKVIQQKTDLQAAFTIVLVDSGSRSFMGLVGRTAASCAGSLLFGPAGWVIGQQLGQVAGARFGKPVSDWVKRVFVREQAARVYDGISVVLASAADEVDPKLDSKDEQEEVLSSTMPSTKANDHIMGHMREEFQEARRYLKNKRVEMLSYARDPRAVFKSPDEGVEEACILTTQAGIHPQALQAQWKQVAEALGDLGKQQRRYGMKM
jgi:hypothetical protein